MPRWSSFHTAGDAHSSYTAGANRPSSDLLRGDEKGTQNPCFHSSGTMHRPFGVWGGSAKATGDADTGSPTTLRYIRGERRGPLSRQMNSIMRAESLLTRRPMSTAVLKSRIFESRGHATEDPGCQVDV